MGKNRQKQREKILLAELRLKLRKGELPYTFVDKREGYVRNEVNRIGKEVGIKFTCNKVSTSNKNGTTWTIDIA